MVYMTLWDDETHKLVCRETRKENEVIPIIKKIFWHNEPFEVSHLWGCNGERYVVWGSKYHLVIKFASRKQLNKFTDFMNEICNGEIEEVYCR